jgi:hypothetical protein
MENSALVKPFNELLATSGQKLLQRLCFLTYVVHLATSHLTAHDWMTHVKQLKAIVLSLQGMLPLCYFLDTDTQRYLTEDHIAEWVLGCSQNQYRSSFVMDATMLVSRHVSKFERMHKVISDNLERKSSLLIPSLGEVKKE